MSSSEDDSRRQEINWFAAMALGGGNDGDNATTTTAAGASVNTQTADFSGFTKSKEEKSAVTTAGAGKEKTGGGGNAPSNIFSEAVLNANPSGTFAMSSNSNNNRNAAAERSNLEAAAAALEDQSTNNNNNNNRDGNNNSHNPMPNGAHPLFGGDIHAAANAQQQQQAANMGPPPQYQEFLDTPMFAERISLPRPVFFGAVLPPRVLQQARQMVQQALEDNSLYTASSNTSSSPNTLPKLADMPRSVRNVVGALRVYGHGLDLWIEATSTNNAKAARIQNLQIDETYWRGQARVSTYQPVWPQQRREKIVERMRSVQLLPSASRFSSTNVRDGLNRRPRHVQRASTAPARIIDDGEDILLANAAAGGGGGLPHPLMGSLSPPILDSHKTPLSSLMVKDESNDSHNNDMVTGVQRHPFGEAASIQSKDISASFGESTGTTSAAGQSAGEPTSSRYNDNDNNNDSESDKQQTKKSPNASQEIESNDDTVSIEKSVAGSVNTTDRGDNNTVTRMSDKNLFSQWANKEAPVSPKVSPKVSPPASPNNPGKVTKMTNKGLFAQWAQGDADDAPHDKREEQADSPSKDVQSVVETPKMTDHNLFSKWAQGDESATTATSTTADSPMAAPTTKMTDRNLFSQWAQGESSSPPLPPTKTDSSIAKKVTTTPKMTDQNLFSQWARGEESTEVTASGTLKLEPSKLLATVPEKISPFQQGQGKDDSASLTAINEAPPLKPPLSEQALFSQWARGGDTGTTDFSSMESVFMPNTFQRVLPPPRTTEDSDDDSVIDDELKKQVGINDHLSKALASLIENDDEEQLQANAGGDQESDQFLLSQIPIDLSQQRPLTNLEITHGCVPLFGVDDPPLPAEGDLGIHETKEDQVKSYEQKRSQEIIDKLVAPNIFGPIACPNPSLHPYDFHSWNARMVSNSSARATSAGGNTAISGYTSVATNETSNNLNMPLLPPDLGRPPHPQNIRSTSVITKDSVKHNTKTQQQQRQIASRSRFGWWNMSLDESSKIDNQIEETSIIEDTLQLPPVHHSSSTLQTITVLEPTPDQLRHQNLPLSLMHAGTWAEHTMPYLCDRPPSYRYLQIDTQAVGFPPIGGEIEPLFCSLSIYNVETLSTGMNDTAVPIPDLRRCGRVTEALYFDVVCDEDVSTRCASTLYPYSDFSPQSKLLQHGMNKANQLQGTRCGVFPLPSNLDVSNLYAVLVVRKVLSDEGEVDHYLKAGKTAPELAKLRSKAEKASKRHGSLLMPFAFGVAPLLQVFGVDNPIMASSRAVQIPLFKFTPGLGERQIIDHIMVMLYPRADHRANGIGGPAAVTNGGNAMLVMRNYGYLGLHAVVDNKSSLARDRLVDFTGELQLCRTSKDDQHPDVLAEKKSPFEVNLPDWRPKFTAEPSVDGGRVRTKHSKPAEQNEESNSVLYAQELASVPLQLTPSARTPPMSQGLNRSRIGMHDIEPFYGTTFCNEMLFHPRLLHNCPRGNIVMKVELRELEWDSKNLSYLAHTPACGPSIHNNRRGPFLVQSAFTSCTPRGNDPHFIDEFKLKLPLDVKPVRDGTPRTLALLFVVYKVKIGSKNKWKRAKNFFSSSSTHSDNVSESDDTTAKDVPSKTSIQQIACGFLPLTKNSSVVDNGMHDVRVEYVARPLLNEASQGNTFSSTLRLVEKAECNDATTSYHESMRDDSLAEETMSVESGISERNPSEINARTDSSAASVSELASLAEDSHSKKSKAASEPISLSVRIVLHSSLHTQNETLSEFFDHEPDAPRTSLTAGSMFLSTIRLGRKFIMDNVELRAQSKSLNGESKLLDTTVAITKHQFCSLAYSSPHLLRIMPILWRSLIIGTGEPDFTWANPATSTPLRVHTFATILHLLGATTLYMTKNGLQRLDGVSKWNVVTMSRVLSLLFDEEQLFGAQAYEIFDEKEYTWNDEGKAPKAATNAAKKRRHVRQTFEFVNEVSRDKVSGKKNLGMSMTKAGTISFGSTPLDKSSFTFDSVLGNSSVRFSSDGSESSKSGSSDTAEDVGLFLEGLGQQAQRDIKIDTKNDFQSALRAAAASEEDFDKPANQPKKTGNASANAFLQAFGDSSRNRRWMTAPLPLSTIRESEDHDVDESENTGNLGAIPEGGELVEESLMDGQKSDRLNDLLDSELVLTENSTRKLVKQMRVPRTKKTGSDDSTDSTSVSSTSSSLLSTPPPNMFDSLGTTDDTSIVTPSEEEMENAGTAFLEAIGKSLGLSSNSQRMVGEEQHVGSSHHRKTRSRSSIDWTLLADDRSDSSVDSTHADSTSSLPSDLPRDQNVTETLFSIASENRGYVKLPNFVDRLNLLGKSLDNSSRWFPYAYEVIIMQWAALLKEQRSAGDRKNTDPLVNSVYQDKKSHEGAPANESLSLAAQKSVGVIVAGAPLMFEVIKQSLGFRISRLFKALSRDHRRTCPPLVLLDTTLLHCLEQIITMVSDACIDSRNFDTWELRQMSIDVNDSIIRFLRDLFAFMVPSAVQKLILVYLSRFVTREGKQWQDRDSAIGLRCSWEITKLRLNAITALVRFPDLVRVNSPQMLSWNDWWQPPTSRISDAFYDDMLASFSSLNMSSFVGGEGVSTKLNERFPNMRPHWLSEMIVDVCLLGTEHAEQYIQHRSGSLLHELFWTSSQNGIMNGIASPVASMYVTYIEKLLNHVKYMSNFAPKSQLRKDVFPCAIYVLQSAPPGLLRALWRKLLLDLRGKGSMEKYGVNNNRRQTKSSETDGDTLSKIRQVSITIDTKESPHILDVFSLLNLCLKSTEYEGDEKHLEVDNSNESRDNVEQWRREFLLSNRNPPLHELGNKSGSKSRRHRTSSQVKTTEYCTASSRKWQAHDSALTIINTGHRIVWELYKVLNSSEGEKLLNPAIRNRKSRTDTRAQQTSLACSLSTKDVVVFVRAVTSLYLHALALRLSDISIVRTFKLSAELIKIFGIKMFLDAVGETLQHWMRVISLLSGARRAQVRIEATDLCELILRSTWDCFGSFFRIRVPLLAVQTEVMERIVATAAARYYRNLRLDGSSFETFSTMNAEASLVPLWRTLDRMAKQPASQNIAFRGALIRMAEKLKKLYRAYVAARVLSFIQTARATGTSEGDDQPSTKSHEIEAQLRAKRISILRVINASEGHSKQFLGFQGTAKQKSQVAHFEAVEDALIDAADVFSPTELPEHRVAWLRMLADFHATRKKFAEEATCHFHIHVTLHQAARLHGSFWSNTPFLPWTDNIPDPVYIDGDSPTVDVDYNSVYDVSDLDAQNMDNASSFRRIFYRVANSVGMFNDDWEGGVSKNLFFGVTFPTEYYTLSPWITFREMEEALVEEAEAAGDLFLKAGIIESSRLSWNLATVYYAEKYNFAKLAMSYGNLARTVVSKMPSIDSSLPQEVSTTLGRYYRVWFHGGAPDELSGIEFVYRTEGDVKLDQFGKELRDVIKSIIPDRTPIHLLLDGRGEERTDETAGGFVGFSRIGPAPLEPVKIKVTPLRPIFGRNSSVRGLPEWFHRYVDEAFSNQNHRSTSDINSMGHQRRLTPSQSEENREHPHRDHVRSYSASVFSSIGSSNGNAPSGRRNPLSAFGDGERAARYSEPGHNELSGIDKFCFLQPKDRKRSLKDWWKNPSGDITEKTLKITQLQVRQSFPACVARQAVVHRLVYSQSPLEAGVDAVCQWCAVLFRTAVAAAGQSVLQINDEPGIGTEATKIVADSIHYSHIKDIGLTLLKKHSSALGNEDSLDFNDYDRLTEDETKKLQLKLARVLIVFIELLHLLISRNRDLLLNVMKDRKLEVITSNMSVGTATIGGSSRAYSRTTSIGPNSSVPETIEREKRRVHSMGQDPHDFGATAPTITQANARRRPVSSDNIQQQHQRINTEGSRIEDVRHRSIGSQQQHPPQHHHARGQSVDEQSVISQNSLGAGTNAGGAKISDSAIAVHGELQRAFIKMVKDLHPRILNVMQQADTPRWLKQCTVDNYFSLGTYKQNKMPIAEELCFKPGEMLMSDGAGRTHQHLANPSIDSPRSAGGGSSHSVVSRGSEKYGLGQF